MSGYASPSIACAGSTTFPNTAGIPAHWRSTMTATARAVTKTSSNNNYAPVVLPTQMPSSTRHWPDDQEDRSRQGVSLPDRPQGGQSTSPAKVAAAKANAKKRWAKDRKKKKEA